MQQWIALRENWNDQILWVLYRLNHDIHVFLQFWKIMSLDSFDYFIFFGLLILYFLDSYKCILEIVLVCLS